MATSSAPKSPPLSPLSPSTPTSWSEDIPWRKRVPFDLIGRGVAGVDEMAEYLDDTKVYFGLISIQVGSGSFMREKFIFVHFNGEKHPKPLQRAKANKKKPSAKKLLSPFHAELVFENAKQCTIDYVFSKLGHIFTADNFEKGQTKFEIGSLKDEYKQKMLEARKKAQAEREKLEQAKKKLLEKQERKRKAKEEQKRREEEEQRRKEEEAKRIAEEEERKRKEEEEKKAEEERKKKEEEERIKKEEEERIKKEEEEKKKKLKAEKAEKAKKLKLQKKKKLKGKKRKKDDWSDDIPWTGKRVVQCIHQETSPLNWGVFKPSDHEIFPMAFGHGDLNAMREALKSDQVQYGIMRLTFGEGRFRRTHIIFVTWSPDTMTKNVAQKVRKQRQQDRMIHISWKVAMQKLIGPFGVEVLAESYDMVTLEDWILRVRKIVAVDGSDDFMNAESFQKALAAEKAHFDAIKKKKEEEMAKKLAAESSANEESSEEENENETEDDENNQKILEKKKKKKKLKSKKSEKKEEDEENENEEEEEEEEEDENEENVNNNNNNNNNNKDESKEEELKNNNNDNDEKVENNNMSLLRVDVNMDDEEENTNNNKKNRKASINPELMKEREFQSQLCYESIVLMKRPDTDCVWVLMEPRLPLQGTVPK